MDKKLTGKNWLIIAIAAILLVSVGAVFYFNTTYIFINGDLYDRRITVLDLTDKRISVSEYENFKSELPNCEIIWTVPIGETGVRCDAAEISANQIPPDNISIIKYLPNLKKIDTTGFDNFGMLVTLKSQYPELEIDYTVPILGVNVGSGDDFADISGIAVTDLEPLKQTLSYLPALKKIEMIDCGLSNEQFDELIEAFPDKKFIWTISFGRWTDIRTDIVCFSSLNHDPQRHLTEATFSPLFRYCTDLISLDLGHNKFTDLSEIKNLTKLKHLILADTCLVNVEPLGALTNLEWLEIQINKIEDISALANLKEMKWLEISYNPLTALSPVLEMPKLQKLFASMTSTAEDNRYFTREKLRSQLPEGCMSRLNTTETDADAIRLRLKPGQNLFRDGEAYWMYRMASRHWRLVESMTGWEDIEYKDGHYVRFEDGKVVTDLEKPHY